VGEKGRAVADARPSRQCRVGQVAESSRTKLSLDRASITVFRGITFLAAGRQVPAGIAF
jgi:hypothetical protein